MKGFAVPSPKCLPSARLLEVGLGVGRSKAFSRDFMKEMSELIRGDKDG
jgi:hypothetical protein